MGMKRRYIIVSPGSVLLPAQPLISKVLLPIDRTCFQTDGRNDGYGQGQILVNPLHMAGLYTAFCNGGNALKPRLVYEDEADMDAGSNIGAEIWLDFFYILHHTHDQQ